MKTITELTKPVLTLDGQPIVEGGRPVTAATIIGNSLAATACATPIRAIDLGIKLIALNGTGRMDVDDADYQMMVDAINGNQSLTNLGKAAALRVLEGAHDPETRAERRRAKD